MGEKRRLQILCNKGDNNNSMFAKIFEKIVIALSRQGLKY